MKTAVLRLPSAFLLTTAIVAAPPWALGQAAQPAKADALPAAPAEKLHREGLPNLGRVNDQLYRGGQPEKEGYDALRQLGVEIVVNFRNNPKKDEQQQVESRDMRYVLIPWSSFDAPHSRQVAEFLTLLRANPGKKVYVHCRRGAERTGVMVSAYRIAEQSWTAEQALDEMEQFKFRGFWFRHLKTYVRSFPDLLKTDAAFRTLQAAPQPVPATPYRSLSRGRNEPRSSGVIPSPPFTLRPSQKAEGQAGAGSAFAQKPNQECSFLVASGSSE